MKKKYAYIYYIITIDKKTETETQHCSHCHLTLCNSPAKAPKKCPRCRYELVESGDVKIKGRQYEK